MRVTVRLFAMLRQQAGWQQRDIELSPGSTIEAAWDALVAQAPALAASRSIVRFARNRQYAAADEALADGDELVLIPPVAGGAGPSGADGTDGRLLRCEIVAAPISDDLLAELRVSVPTAADGAVVLFVGQTRETPGTPAPGEEEEAARHAGELVRGLDYEAFAEMAITVLRTIGDEIEQQFGVRRLAIIHRTGRVDLGQPSVVICAAAPHRAQAFDACRYAIEELKARAPIWKAEHYAAGSVWIGAKAREGSVGSG